MLSLSRRIGILGGVDALGRGRAGKDGDGGCFCGLFGVVVRGQD